MNGQELLQHRQNLGLSRKEFAQKMPFSEKTLQNLENLDSEDIPKKYVKAIEDVLEGENLLNKQVETHLRTDEEGTSIEFLIKEDPATDNKTISSIASQGTSEADQNRVLNETEGYLKRFVSKLPRQVVINIYALYLYVKDSNVDLHTKFIAFGALLYFISPVDAIPDVTPIVGLIDDIGVLALAIGVYKNSEEFQKKQNEAMEDLIQKGWIA